jgi:hypothetical protein
VGHADLYTLNLIDSLQDIIYHLNIAYSTGVTVLLGISEEKSSGQELDIPVCRYMEGLFVAQIKKGSLSSRDVPKNR